MKYCTLFLLRHADKKNPVKHRTIKDDPQWNFIQPQRKMKFGHLKLNWKKLENIILSEVIQVQKIKATCFLSECGI
jgi:hypothetical protein